MVVNKWNFCVFRVLIDRKVEILSKCIGVPAYFDCIELLFSLS